MTDKTISSKRLRQMYLDFFKSKGHAIIPSASLIPENDPTVLFNTAGMQPLVPYLVGQKHPSGKRIADSQKCIRTVDIDDVGDNRHLTFFEMLGNWSLGDYFKREAIEWSWEFMTSPEWLNLNPEKLYITVFMGDENCPIDNESIEIWQEQFKKVNIKAEICPYNEKIGGNKNYRIFPLPAKDNWWGPAGETGPCGPCSEMFYDVNPDKEPLKGSFDEEVDNFRVMEIWNDVFMEYNKTQAGKFEKLAQKNVDTGMGLERTIAVLNGKRDAFDNDTFYNLFHKIENLSGKSYIDADTETKKAIRIITDHLKAATFIMGDDKGVTPSNTDQGYIVRRLIRRAIRYGRLLGIPQDKPWTKEIAKLVAHDYAMTYPELQKNINKIIDELNKEEIKFTKTLERGLKEFEKMKPKFSPFSKKSGTIEYALSGDDLFNLYQTFGFPIEMSLELAKERGVTIDLKGFNKELKKHQELSRTASAGKFKGGLADAGEETTKLHTAAHLLLAALRKVLGDHVVQKGSNITAERLRFDFSHNEKMTDEQKQEVEKIVNEAIEKKMSVKCEEMSLDEAKKAGAMGVFESKYGDKVKVYTVGEGDDIFSKEICGGPHIDNTSTLGKFKIKKEESSSAGIRRVKAELTQ